MIANFRVWDKTRKKMVTFDFWDIEAKYTKGHRYTMIDDDICIDSFWGTDPNIVLMQSTGLQDKNGVEIFEGDIVRFEGGAAEGHRLGVIDYGDGSYFVDCTEHDDTKYYRLMDYLLEVIGNIHQNPDLVETNR